MNNLKIRVSNNAFEFLNNLLKFHDEYDCISIKQNQNSTCCKSPKVEIQLDNISNFSETTNIDGLNFSYSSELSNSFKDITIVINNSSIYVKATPIIAAIKQKSCSANCNKSCKGCKH